jgi:hypothetical protein
MPHLVSCVLAGLEVIDWVGLGPAVQARRYEAGSGSVG